MSCKSMLNLWEPKNMFLSLHEAPSYEPLPLIKRFSKSAVSTALCHTDQDSYWHCTYGHTYKIWLTGVLSVLTVDLDWQWITVHVIRITVIHIRFWTSGIPFINVNIKRIWHLFKIRLNMKKYWFPVHKITWIVNHQVDFNLYPTLCTTHAVFFVIHHH